MMETKSSKYLNQIKQMLLSYLSLNDSRTCINATFLFRIWAQFIISVLIII